ncbi:MAG: M28 family peptidase [Planctomycetota bacterium]
MRLASLIASGGFAAATMFAPMSRADTIESMINQASLSEYESYLRVLTGIDPVIAGIPAHYLSNRYSFGTDIMIAGGWIHNQFESFGLTAAQHTYDPAYGPNVVAVLPGTVRPQDIYIYCAHYDTYHSADQLNAPGCDDNGSGTAAVLMAARILSQYHFEATIRFVAFSGEEQWMVGSQAYAEAASVAGDNIIGAINLDMFLQPGFDNQNPDPDYDLDIGGNNASQWLCNQLASSFSQYTPIDFELHNDDGFVSDQWAFWQYGYDAVGCIENTPNEIWGGSNDAYHQLTDTMDNPDYDWDFALHTVRGSMAALIELATVIPCYGDTNGDGHVNTVDFFAVIAAWGQGGVPEDINGDGVVNVVDFFEVIAAWGPCAA